MVRRSRFQNDIELQVDGPPIILRKPVRGRAKMNETWYNFLARNGVKLTSPDRIVVRTCNGFKTSDKKAGWTAELNEQVQKFVCKFERAKVRYSVKLSFKEKLRTPSEVTTTSQGQRHRVRGSSVNVPLTRSPGNLQGRPRSQNGGQQSTRLVYRTGSTAATNPNKSPPNQRRQQRQRRPQRGPSIVIPTARGAGGPSTSTSENSYRRPRYTPGIINGSPRGSTQSRYGTRLKGLSERENLNGLGGPPRQTARMRMGSPPINNGGLGGHGNLNGMAVVKVDREDVWAEEEEGSDVSGGGDGGGGANGGLDMDPFGLSDLEEEEDDDNLSLCTAVTTEENELQREGIRVQDIKTRAVDRLEGNFNNSYLLRMRKEVRDLKRSGMWVRNVQKAPLACFLLQEMLKC